MALLVVERFERDTREVVGRVIRLLAPAPGRLEFATRLAAVCVLTTLIVQIYGTPDPALTVYVAFFMIKPDRVSSIITDLVFMVIITVVLGLIFLVSLIVVDEASLRVAAIALISFVLLFLTSSSKLEPVGQTAALIVGYGLDLLGSTPAGELATRAYLYAWLFIGIPACVSIVCNLVFGPSPLSLARRALALRMRVAARALLKPDEEDRGALKNLLREGNTGIRALLRFAALEHTVPAGTLTALTRATNGSLAILSAVDFTLETHQAALPPGLRARLARTLSRIATVIRRGGFPAEIELPAQEEMSTSAAAAYVQIVKALSDLTDPSAPVAPAAKEKAGFFVPDAFSNSMHVYYALKTTLAAMFCYILYSVLDWPGIHTAFITCYIVSLKTVAETVEKLTLRVAGGLIGAGLGLLTIIFIVPSHDSITDLAAIVLVASLAAGWIAAGSPHIAYVGFQFAFAFFLCVIQGSAPSQQLSVARDRVVGLLLGDFVAFAVHTQLWPVSLKGRIEKGIALVLRTLTELAGTRDAARRQVLAADAHAELGALDGNIALIAYEPGSVRPPGRWLDLRQRIAALLAWLAPSLWIDSEQSDTTDVSRHLAALAERKTHVEPQVAQQSAVGAIVRDKIDQLDIALQEERLAQS